VFTGIASHVSAFIADLRLPLLTFLYLLSRRVASLYYCNIPPTSSLPIHLLFQTDSRCCVLLYPEMRLNRTVLTAVF